MNIRTKWALGVLALGLVSSKFPMTEVQGEALYHPGDVVTVRTAALDSLGRAFLPTSARGFVFTSAGVLDSSQTYPSGGITQPIPGVSELKWSYTIPAGTEVVDYMFTTIFTGEGFTRDLAVSEPGRARVNAFLDSVRVVATAIALIQDMTPDSIRAVGTVAILTEDVTPDSIRAVGTTAELTEVITASVDSVRAVGITWLLDEEITASVAAVDSLTPNAVQDIIVASAGSNYAVLDSTSCTTCGVYHLGSGVSGAPVYITRSTRLYTAADIVGGDDRTVDGAWLSTPIPLNPGVPDTFYVWSWWQNTYVVNGVQVVIP